MHPDMQQARDALGPALAGRLGDAMKRLAYRRQVSLSGWGQDHLPRQPLEQLHAQPLLQLTDLLANGASGDMQLVRGLLEAEMASRRLEGTERIEGWQQISHGQSPGSERLTTMHEASSSDKGEHL